MTRRKTAITTKPVKQLRLGYHFIWLIPVVVLIGLSDRFGIWHPVAKPKQHSQATEATRNQLSPLPVPQEIWECSVVVVGGSLGGVAAASHAMKSGAKTCLIELSPWLGGQISSQGVSAVDESLKMRALGNFSESCLSS